MINVCEFAFMFVIRTASVRHCKHSFLPNRCPEIHLTSLFWTDIWPEDKTSNTFSNSLSLAPWAYLDCPPFKLPSPLNPIMNLKAGHKANCQPEKSLKLSLTPHNNDIHLKLWQKNEQWNKHRMSGHIIQQKNGWRKIIGISQWTPIFLSPSFMHKHTWGEC